MSEQEIQPPVRTEGMVGSFSLRVEHHVTLSVFDLEIARRVLMLLYAMTDHPRERNDLLFAARLVEQQLDSRQQQPEAEEN